MTGILCGFIIVTLEYCIISACTMADSPKLFKVVCSNCNVDVSQLYINCVDCQNVKLCLQCFASGAEFDGHLRVHRYKFCDNGTFSLFEPEWSAFEEKKLIDSVEQFGLGNWEDVAEHIGSKTAKEVEDHYMTVYIDNILGRFTVPHDIPNRMTDHTPSIHDSVQLPQVNVSKSNQLELAYMPNRDDFEYEFDNDAESLISSIFMNHDDDDLDKALKLAKVEAYHMKLKERQRRKDIAREYKLVEKFFNKQYHLFSTKFGREIHSNLRFCSQFMKSEQMQKLIEGVNKERRLKHKINRLKNYRKNGITKLDGGCEFEAACFKRIKQKKVFQIRVESDENSKTLSLMSDVDDGNDLTQLSGYPCFNYLCQSEKLQCKSLSMTPAQYLTSKGLIIKDASLKQCGLQMKPRYSTVIDKTQRRRLSCFLQERGWLP
uniref:Transcriptional adapter 2-beta-like n=1 Tax=Phallusia mammillata TaxID=59560 RepID=A0A6F9DUV0_9ASCI|nr:transcriptional adapter 2-beta-like [Phallusia mammillata]